MAPAFFSFLMIWLLNPYHYKNSCTQVSDATWTLIKKENLLKLKFSSAACKATHSGFDKTDKFDISSTCFQFVILETKGKFSAQ